MMLAAVHPTLRVRSPALCTIAQQTAARFVGPLGDRWLHTVGVARRAAELAEVLSLDGDVLVAAAWLHDIGYARVAAVTGFAPLDGARHLADQLWPMRIAGLVAHHLGARFVATARGLGRALAIFPYEPGPVADALVYADLTVGPTGRPAAAHRPDTEVYHLRGPLLRAAVARVERGLSRSGTIG